MLSKAKNLTKMPKNTLQSANNWHCIGVCVFIVLNKLKILKTHTAFSWFSAKNFKEYIWISYYLI